ncbi:hypothetical protein D3C72_2192940 [compost metagenome]
MRDDLRRLKHGCLDAVCRNLNERRSVASGRRFALQRQQGDDDVLFVVEVADQAGGGAVQQFGQTVAVVGGVRGLSRDRLMEGDGGMV